VIHRQVVLGITDDAAALPELLILGVLDTTLRSLQFAQIGAFPELTNDFSEKRACPRARAAKQLSNRAADLTTAI
jgi:hypothetical protein